MRTRLLALAAGMTLFTGTVYAQTTVEILHAWGGHEKWHQAIAKDFMAANPDIKIEFHATAASYDEGVQTVIRQSFAGQEPDIYFNGYHLINQLVLRDLALDLGPLLEGTDLAALGLNEDRMALGQVDGRQVSFPATSSTPVMYLNADLVRQAGGDPDNMPTDWDSFIKLAGAIDALGDDIAGMYYELGHDDWMFQNLILNFGGELMKDGAVAFDGPEGQAAMALFKRFHDEGGQPAVSRNDARAQLFSGRMGMYFGSAAFVRKFENSSKDVFEGRTAVQPLADASAAAMPTGGMAGVILETEDEAVQAAALKYLLFMAGPEGQTHVVLNTGYMPLSTKTLEPEYLGDYYKDHPNWFSSVKQLPLAVPWFQWPGLNGVEIGKVINDGFTAIAHGADPQERLAEMAAKVSELVEE